MTATVRVDAEGRGDRPRAIVVRTGSANLASVQAGFRRIGVEAVLSEDPEEVKGARLVVLPGVGALGETKARLDRLGLSAVLAERARAGRPLLAVCLGLQLLLEESEESPGVAGLGLIHARATRFPAQVRVPQLGWNTVTVGHGARYLESGEFYFANSYRVLELPRGEGWVSATAEHGGEFVAAFERGALLACQFHPELSGSAGHRILARWVERSVLQEPAS